MNSSPYLVPSLIFLAAVLSGCAAWAVIAIISRPREPAVEILTGPGAPSPQTSEVLIGVPARVRDKR